MIKFTIAATAIRVLAASRFPAASRLEAGVPAYRVLDAIRA